MNIERFWMVYGIGQSVPKYQHASIESAEREARRLAELHTGITFVVLAAVRAYATPPAVIEVRLTDREDEF